MNPFKRNNTKEEKPSSPSPQPTSGTSRNPSQSTSLVISNEILRDYGLGSLFQMKPNPPPQNESKFQPEHRAVPVVGFRAWHALRRHKVGVGPAWQLHSVNQAYGHLDSGVNTAVCMASTGSIFTIYSSPTPTHKQGAPVPDPGCTCGYYVLNDIDAVPFEVGKPKYRRLALKSTQAPAVQVVGAVVGWGRVVQHADEGWRAEKIQVIALLDCKVDDLHLEITEQVAAAYGVPVLSRRGLELLAAEYGEPAR